MDYLARAREVLEIEADSIRKVCDGLDGEFNDAVRVLLERVQKRGKIVVTGVGKSYHIAQKISATLASTGSTSVVLNPTQAMHGDLGMLCADDALLALSYSGESEELIALIPLVKREGIPIIALTGSRTSTLARHSDIVLLAAVEREACPFNMAPTSSTTVALAMGDALAMALLDARGFRREDYAKLHPGGAIGRALLLKVADIMRTGDAAPRVPETATIREALLAMTRARAGSIGIVNAEGCVAGIFTDGDLRRHISDAPGFLGRSIRDVMTQKPITVKADQLAVDVLRVYEQHRIDDVLVVDDAGRMVGAIDIQDLPKIKIL